MSQPVSGADPTGGLGAAALVWLQRLGRQRLSTWDRQLRAAGVPLSRALLCGSTQTGLLGPAKAARYCGSPAPAPRPRVVELDVRLILAPDTDLTDHRLLGRVAATTGTRLARSEVVTRWQVPIPMAVFYTHQILTDHTAIEWEVCLNLEPYFETTPYWGDVFSRSEIDAQRHTRTVALDTGVSRDVYELLKSWQGQTFRWRLCMAIAHLPAARLPTRLRDLADDLDRYPAVRAMVDQARKGHLPHPGTAPWAASQQLAVQEPPWLRMLPQPE